MRIWPPGDNSPPLAACKGEGESEVGKDDGKGDSQESGGDAPDFQHMRQIGHLDGGMGALSVGDTHSKCVHVHTQHTKGELFHTHYKPNTHE